jgi:hypothetical protein
VRITPADLQLLRACRRKLQHANSVAVAALVERSATGTCTSSRSFKTSVVAAALGR